MSVSGGLNKEAVAKATEKRGGDFRAWVRTTKEVKEHPFSQQMKDKARAFISAGRRGLRDLDKEAIKEHRPEDMKQLGAVLKGLATLGDELVALAEGSIRGASAAVRQAQILEEGSLPLDAERLEGLRGLVGEAQLGLLQDMAKIGVPLLQSHDSAPQPIEGPYESAKASAGALGFTAVGDVAQGRSLLVTEASEGALRSAAAVVSRLGAVPKKDARGQPSGDFRPVTDLRDLNTLIAELADELRKQIALEAPPAVCPRVISLVRAIIYLARRFPGVPIGGGKSDLAEAFKLIHMLIADVPSTAWALPTDGLPDLEDKKFIIQIAFMLAFGFNKAPGWFGVLAWVLAEAHAALGPDEPALNGADSYGGGAPHMDDYFLLAVQLGQRWEMAYEHYTLLARMGGGDKAINALKDSLHGYPSEVSGLWGRVLDTRGIPRGGPLAGLLTSPTDKVLKLQDQLKKGGFAKLHLRRLTRKELAETTGLAVWLSVTNLLIKALLPSFYAAMASKDITYVDPPGSKEAVRLVWAELSDAAALMRQQCEDVKKFTTSFQSSLLRALSPREQVSLGVPRAWLQSDSTGKDPVLTKGGEIVRGPDGEPRYKVAIFALACFFLGVYGVDTVERYEELLQSIVGMDRETHIIVGELLPVVSAAMEHGEEWRGMLITCAIDNAAVVSAINLRASTHPFVRYLVLLLVRLAALHGFMLWAYYINTKRNILADQMTRLKLSPEELQQYVDSIFPGLKRKVYTKLYDFLLQEKHALARSFALPIDGPEGTERLLEEAEERQGWWRAVQAQESIIEGGSGGGLGAEEQREEAGVRQCRSPTRAKFVEVYGGAGNGAVAAAKAGMDCVAIVEKHVPGRHLAMERLQKVGMAPSQFESVVEATAVLSAASAVELVLVASPPPGQAALAEVPALVECLRPKVLCVELVPASTTKEQSAIVQGWSARLQVAGYQLLESITGSLEAEGDRRWETVDVADLGGRQRRERVVLHFEEAVWAHVAGPLMELQPRPGPPQGLGGALDPLELVGEELYVEGSFSPATQTNVPTRPQLAGYLHEAGGKHAVEVGSVVTLRGDVSRAAEAEARGTEWVVRFAEPGGALRLLAKEVGRQEPRQRVAQRDEVVEHVQRRRPVWSADGVGATVCSSKGTVALVLEERGEGEARVRRLSMRESWKLQGLSEDDLALHRNKRPGGLRPWGEVRSSVELDIAARTQHSVLAAATVARAQARLEVMEHRLKLVPSKDPEPVYREVELLGTGESAVVRCRSGSTEEAGQLTSYNREFVGMLVRTQTGPEPAKTGPGQRACGGTNRPLTRPVVVPGRGAREALVRASTAQLVQGSLTAGSQSTYDSSFKHWVSWRAGRRAPVFLDGRNPREDEDELLLFVTHKALNADFAHSSIHVMLYALRFKHLMARYPDPLEDKTLLKIAMKGISRLQGGPWRKIPASMDMIRWIVSQLDLDNNDELLVAIALVMMFLFLLRSREALRKGEAPDAKQCLRVKNVVLVGGGVVKSGSGIQEADEVVLMQGASKTDPNGQGSVANSFEAPGDELCLIGLLKRLQRQKPGHFSNPESFFFTLSDGRVLHRNVIAGFMREGAVAFGAPKEAAAVISLRSGGASAMWDQGFAAEDIKKRGRWASDCYRIYIWDGHDRARDVAARMLSSKFSLMASLAAYKRHAA